MILCYQPNAKKTARSAQHLLAELGFACELLTDDRLRSQVGESKGITAIEFDDGAWKKVEPVLRRVSLLPTPHPC